MVSLVITCHHTKILLLSKFPTLYTSYLWFIYFVAENLYLLNLADYFFFPTPFTSGNYQFVLCTYDHCLCFLVCSFVLILESAAVKSLQSCPTLCDPIDGSPPDSPVPGILQARTLEWVAISFSNARKWKVKVKSLSHVRLFTTPWSAAHQAPPSMGFSRQSTGVGRQCLLCPPPGDLPNPGTGPRSPALQVDSLPSEPPRKPKNTGVGSLFFLQ